MPGRLRAAARARLAALAVGALLARGPVTAAPAPASTASTASTGSTGSTASTESGATGAPSGAPASAAAYLRAYGLLAGRIGAVKIVHALCATQAPDGASAREAAMAAWRRRHAALLRLVDEQPARMAAAGARLPAAQRIDVDRLERARAGLAERTRRALAADPGRLRAACDRFAEALAAPDMALETVEADAVATLRRGPPGTLPAAPPEAPDVPDADAACPGPDVGAGCPATQAERAQRDSRHPPEPPPPPAGPGMRSRAGPR